MKKPKLRPLPKFSPVSSNYKAAQKRMREIEIAAHLESGEPLSFSPPPPPEDHPNRKEWEDLSAEIHAEIMGRLGALLNHYFIEATNPYAYLLLSVHLANDLIPNFNVFPNPPGRRKRLISLKPDGVVSSTVDEVARQRGCGVRDACRQLQKRSDTPFVEWSADGKSKKPWSPATLETRYYEDKARVESRIIGELIESGEIAARYKN